MKRYSIYSIKYGPVTKVRALSEAGVRPSVRLSHAHGTQRVRFITMVTVEY